MNYSKKHLKRIAYRYYMQDEYNENFGVWYRRIVKTSVEIARYDTCNRKQKRK